MKSLQQPRGYAALITVVMVMLTVLAIGLTLTVMSADQLLSTLRYDIGVRTAALADSCAYDTALQLRDQGLAYVGSHTVTLSEGSCVIVVTNTTGSMVEVELDAVINTSHRLVAMTMDVSTDSILLWQEVTD